MALLEPLFANPQSPEAEARRKQKMAEMLLAGGQGPVTHPLQALGNMAQTYAGNRLQGGNKPTGNAMFDLGRRLTGRGFPAAPQGLF